MSVTAASKDLGAWAQAKLAHRVMKGNEPTLDEVCEMLSVMRLNEDPQAILDAALAQVARYRWKVEDRPDLSERELLEILTVDAERLRRWRVKAASEGMKTCGSGVKRMRAGEVFARALNGVAAFLVLIVRPMASLFGWACLVFLPVFLFGGRFDLALRMLFGAACSFGTFWAITYLGCRFLKSRFCP